MKKANSNMKPWEVKMTGILQPKLPGDAPRMMESTGMVLATTMQAALARALKSTDLIQVNRVLIQRRPDAAEADAIMRSSK